MSKQKSLVLVLKLCIFQRLNPIKVRRAPNPFMTAKKLPFMATKNFQLPSKCFKMLLCFSKMVQKTPHLEPLLQVIFIALPNGLPEWLRCFSAELRASLITHICYLHSSQHSRSPQKYPEYTCL